MWGLYYWCLQWKSIWFQKLPPQIQDPNKTYIENTRLQFLKLISNDNEGDNEIKKKLSTNIDSLIYNKKALLQVLIDSDNSLEKSWRTRMLIESTPVGNIVMFYDIFKQGFSYYCDQPVIPYDILNSVAMKYVVRFHCMDFFMDEHILGVHGCSPLKSIFFEEDEKKVEKKTDYALDVDLKTAPFAKLKNYSISTKKDKISSNIENSNKSPIYFRTNYPWLWKMWFRIQYYLVLPIYKSSVWLFYYFGNNSFNKTWRVVEVENSEIKEEKIKEKEKILNKFIYLGRFRNLNILQKPIKKNIFGGCPTKYDSMFNCSNNGKAISYKDFKPLKNSNCM